MRIECHTPLPVRGHHVVKVVSPDVCLRRRRSPIMRSRQFVGSTMLLKAEWPISRSASATCTAKSLDRCAHRFVVHPFYLRVVVVFVAWSAIALAHATDSTLVLT